MHGILSKHLPPSREAETDSFDILGEFRNGELVGQHTPLEQRETSLEGREQEEFLCLVRKMLQWEPERRSSAQELEQDEWLQAQLRKGQS